VASAINTATMQRTGTITRHSPAAVDRNGREACITPIRPVTRPPELYPTKWIYPAFRRA
jgi:hypothetical protein